LKISREVKTAILALAAIAVLIFGYNFMKGKNIFDSSREFYALYDNVESLSTSSSVTINGLKVGAVSGIDFLNDNGKIIVRLRITNKDFEFSKNSIAKIYSDGLIGGKSIKIIPDHKGAVAQSGDTLKSEVEVGTLDNVVQDLGPLKDKLKSTLGGLDSLVAGLNEVLDTTGRHNLKGSIEKFNSTMENLDHSTAQLDHLLAKNTTKLDTTFTNLSHTAYNFKTLSDSLAEIKVKSLVRKLDQTLADVNQITDKLNNGEGTAGKLLNDDEVYDNLNHASKQLEELLQDIKLHPRRYINLKFSVFGGKNKTKPYQKPQDSIK